MNATTSGGGFRTAAVLDVLDTARSLGLKRVRAGTSTENEASARVLSRCGFVKAGMRQAVVEVEGRRLDTQDWHLGLT